jgi:hypothetical protein
MARISWQRNVSPTDTLAEIQNVPYNESDDITDLFKGAMQWKVFNTSPMIRDKKSRL